MIHFPHHKSKGYNQSNDILLLDKMKEQFIDSDARHSVSLLGKETEHLSLDNSPHPVECVHTQTYEKQFGTLILFVI